MRVGLVLAWYVARGWSFVVAPSLCRPSAAGRAAARPAMTMRLGGGSSSGGGDRLSGSGWSSTRLGRLLGKGGFVWKPPGGAGRKPPRTPRRAAAEASEPEEEPEEETGMWAAYEAALEKNPLLIKGLTSFVGFTIGDLLAQLFIEKSGPYDPLRTLRLASFGFLVHGTTSHWFYGKLDGYIPGKAAKDVASKVFIDQVLWNPIFGVMFFSYIGIFEGSGVKGTIAKIKNDLITQVTGSWTVWPLAHAINFKFIPTEQRVLYINVIQVFYNCFLSIISSKKPEEA